MSTKTQILLVDDVQQQLTHVAELIESHLDAQVTHHTVDHFEPSLSGVLGTTLTAALKYKHELVVFYVAENLAIDAIKVRSMVQSVTSQVILLLENPTVDQTVDLMNAGVAGIADWRDAERVIELIKEHIKTYPSFLMGSICQNIVDYQTELICRYDTNLRLLFVNRAYCEWRGLSAAELIGSSIIENIPLENQENAVAHVRALTRQNPIAVSIHPSVLPDGSLHIIEWTDRAIFNEEGDLAEYQGVGRDVTKREQQAAHLAEMYSELETYRSHMDAILDTMQDALLSVSLPDRETIFVSQSFENIFGYSHKRFTDDPEFFKQVVHPEDLEKSIAAQQQCLKNGFVELEHRIILADGQTRWLHRRGWVNYDENGRPIRINDSARDITQEKLNQQALKERETNLQTLFNTIDDFLFILDQEGQIIEVNQQVTERLGYSLEELAGQSVLMVHPQDRQEEAQQIVVEVLQGKRRTCPVPIQSKDGVQIPVETYVTMGEWNGQPALFGISKDISELKMSEEKFETVFRANPAIAGLSSIETGEYIEVNEAFCETLGFTMEEVLGKKAAELLKLDPKWRATTLQKLQAQGSIHNEETVLLAKDGTPVPVLLSAEVIHLHGKPYNYTTAVDITDRKRAEDALRSSEQQLKSLINSQTNYLVRIDLEGRYTYYNPKFEQDFGWIYGSNGILGNHSLETIAPYHHQRTKETVNKCLANAGVPFQVELDKPTPDKSYHSFLWEFICLTDANGSPVEIQCVGVDIGDLKKAQKTIQYQANILQQVSDAIITFDNNRRITSWNQAATNTYGWSEEEVLGHEMGELVQAEWQNANHENALKTFIETGHWRGELREIDKAGKEHYIIAAVNQLYSDYNEPVGGVIINRDITAEKKLSILQERVQSVLELATMGAVLDTVLNELVLAIEEYQPQTSASILLLDVKTGQLRHGAAPNLPDSYITAVDGTVIGPNVGSCGTAAYEKRLVIVDDIETDPLWADYKALALAHGLRACWSQPVINQKGEVLATLAMYYDKIRKPAAEELAVIKLAAHIAGLAIEHVQTVTALQESEEKYRTLVESSEAVIVVLNEGGDIQFANKITAAHLGMASDAIVGRNMYDFFPADTVDHNLKLVREVMRTGKGVVYESLMPVAGQNYWYRTSIQPIKNATEKISTVLVHASDITQSKAAEAAIRRNEERYRQMFELVKLPKLINDPHTAQILDANPAAVEFYGYPLETLKTMTMLQINIAEPEVVLEKMGQILARKLDRCDSTQRLADGTIREVEGFAVGIEHEGKEALYCTYIDVTERNRARATLQDANRLLEQRVQERTKALEQSRDRIEAIFNHSGDGILLLDDNLQIEQANYSFEQTFATTPADYIGQPLVTFISVEDHTVVEGQIPAVVTQHQTKRIEVQSRRQDGTVFDAEISIAPINRSDNAVRNIVCIIRDITERKQIEAERQKYMAEIEDLYNNAPAGYHSLDQTGVIIQINDTELQWLGYTHEEVTGKRRFAEFLTPESQAIFLAKFPQLQQTGVVDGVEFEMICKDGSTIWVLGSASVLKDKAGNFVHSRATLYNITEIKQAQKAVAEERNLLRTVIDAVPNYIYVKNEQQEIILNNKSHAEFLGSRVTGPQQKGAYMKTFSQGMQEKIKTAEKRILQGEAILENSEDLIVRPDGTPLWTTTTKVPLRNLEHKIIGLVGITSDITYLKQQETQIRESEERYRLTIEAMSEGLVVQDADGAIQLCNSAAERILGLTIEQMMGRKSIDPRWRAIHEDGSPYPGETHPAMVTLRTGEPLSNVVMGVHKPDSSLTWIEINSRLLDHTANKPQAVVTTFTDITERRKAKETIAEERNLLRTVIDAVPDFIYVKDTEHRMVLNNVAHASSIGFAPADVVGKTDFELFPKEMATKYHADEQNLFEMGEPIINVEERSLASIGNEIWALTTKVPLRNLQGELTGLVGITHDVTELKAQEQALRQSEQRMRMILHGTRAGTWDWYVQTGKTIFNERWADIVGYTLEELAPISIQTWVDLTHPDDLESSNQLLEKHFSGETAYYDCQARMKHKEGHWVWVWDRGMVVEWTADGKPLRMLGTHVDITKQRDTELALRESEEKFRMFIESAPIATIISNLDGEIVLVNRATEKLFDYQRDELIGQSIQILVPNDWRDNHKLLMTDYTIAEHLRRSDAMELTARHRDGHIFPADIQLSHVQIDPDPLIMVFVIDITRRKQSEDVLKRSLEREQELSELKSQFVSTASHQFRTPLAAILSTTETLTAYRERMTDKQIGERLDRIRNQVNRMKRLMDDVLELSRIQAKQIQYIPVQSDLDALCREVIDEFAHQEGYQNRIVYEGPGAALISKHDPHLMHHVISNLVHNALKYSEKAVFVYLAQVDDELVFTVKDQGIGIPMDDIKNLFIPFSRARNVGTIEGTGLGLSITKQSVDAHGGSIDIESPPGVGTTFIVKIPKDAKDGETSGN